MITCQNETLRCTDWIEFTSKFTISDTNAVVDTYLAVQVFKKKFDLAVNQVLSKKKVMNVYIYSASTV